MSDILFVTWGGGGNVPPALGIAGELRRRGHRTRFLGHHRQAAAITAERHEFRPYAAAESFVGSEPASLPRLVRLFSDRGMGRDLVAEARRDAPDSSSWTPSCSARWTLPHATDCATSHSSTCSTATSAVGGSGARRRVGPAARPAPVARSRSPRGRRGCER